MVTRLALRSLGGALSMALLFFLPAARAMPNPPEDVVCKPTFLGGYESLAAGTGFVARLPDDQSGCVFLSAFHLFGPAGGLEHDLSPQEARDFAVALAALSMQHPTLIVTSTDMLLIPTARAFSQHDATHDVAAFRLLAYCGAALSVASANPKVGDAVFLLARPREEHQLRLLRAVVSRVGKDALEYVYDEGKVNFAGTSGAPVLNQAGEVVGINLGGGEFKGKTFGFANPAFSFVPPVAAGFKASNPVHGPLSACEPDPTGSVPSRP